MGDGKLLSQNFLTHTWSHRILGTHRRQRALGLEKRGGYGVLRSFVGGSKVIQIKPERVSQ